jgi:queuosine precursor transporter
MLYGILYLLSIIAANLAIHLWGILEIGPLVVPAGAFFVGMTFTLRDSMQQEYGRVHCWWWTLTAAALSALFAPTIALASVAAFLGAETVDWAVFTWTGGSPRQRAIRSNICGIPLDSLIFVPLVFGWVWPAILGQAVVKLISSFIVIGLVKK